MRISRLSASSVLARSLVASSLLFFAAATACSSDIEGVDDASSTGGLGGDTGTGGTKPGGNGLAGETGSGGDTGGAYGSAGETGAGGTSSGGQTGQAGSVGQGGAGTPSCEANGQNLALASTGVVPTAKSTYSGYSVLTVNDGSASTVQTESESWCNDWPNQTFPQWVELTFPEPRTFGRVELYTSDGYPVADYDLEYWDGSEWVSLAVVKNNSQVHRTHTFGQVTAEKFRVLTRKGYTQPTYHRINELELYCQ